MNSSIPDPMSNSPSAGASETVDATLRLITKVPVPDGLEGRIHRELRSTSSTGRLPYRPVGIDGGWMRSAAAAAIVVVVAGGGWSVYSRVQHPQPAKVMLMPAAGPASGGFSSSGAMRTPTTLNAPVLKHPLKKPSAKGKKAQPAAVATRSAQADATAAPATPIEAPAR